MSDMPHIEPAEKTAMDPYEFHGTDWLAMIEELQPRRYRTRRYMLWAIDGERAVFIPPHWEFDGASGPAIDGIGNMLAAMIHDALYEILSHGRADGLTYAQADRVYRRVCIAQGAGRCRAWTHWTALRYFGWIHRLLH